MTIKSKLTVNAIVVLSIIVGVVLASVAALVIVKGRLYDLTEKSTPFQTRTMEFQRAIHASTADLIKVGYAANQGDLKTYQAEARSSLDQVKNVEETVGKLLGGKVLDVHKELISQANDLFSVTSERLRLEGEAVKANNEVRAKLREVAGGLGGLDQKVKSLQSKRSANYSKSLDATNTISTRLREIQDMTQIVKDIQLWCYEMEHSKDRSNSVRMKGPSFIRIAKVSADKVFTNKDSETDRTVTATVADLEKRIDSLADPSFDPEKASADAKQKYHEAIAAVMQMANVLETQVQSGARESNDRYTAEAKQQAQIFTQVGKATVVLNGTSELISLGLSTEGLATRLFTLNESKEVAETKAALEEVFSRIDKSVKVLDGALATLDAKDERKILASTVMGLRSMKELLFERNGIIGKVENYLAMKEKSAKVMEGVRSIVLKQAEEAKKTMSSAKRNQEQSISQVNWVVKGGIGVVIVIGFIAIVFGVSLSSWIYRSISKPFTRLVGLTAEIASGNLTKEVGSVAKDEAGKVEGSMGEMVVNLKRIVGNIRGTTEKLASSSEELSATARSLDEGSESQSQQIEQAAGAMTQMSQTTEEMAKNASDTANAATSMKHIAENGREIANASGEELRKFVDTVNESCEQIESLGKSSEEIQNIVDLIKEIADQTNLLALNAAIEAARAGDQGRGFAVVADNVRELAEKTVVAADDIAGMVGKMRTEVIRSVHAMNGQKVSVGRVEGQVEETSSAIRDLVRHVERVSDMIARIAAAVEEQAATTNEVTHNMENIATVTRQLRESSTGTRQTAEGLSRIAVELNQMTGWFRI